MLVRRDRRSEIFDRGRKKEERGNQKGVGFTYEVDLRRMGELLLSIGTLRRICGKKKDGQRGATTTPVESKGAWRKVSSRAYQRKWKDIPGDKVLCNT